jgi:crotonobetainyl-CoA:carnitine CoA-transferase CaiB-like acyl-CoA transferase
VLSDITVLEFGGRVSTAFCGKLLTDAGATVVKLEPSTGDPLRLSEPAYAAFLHAGKRSVSVAEGGSVVDVVRGLAGQLDVIICDDDEAATVARFAALRDVNPSLVIVSMSDYGLDGSAAGPATEFTLQAEAGVSIVHATDDRPPVVAGAELGELTAAAAAAVGVITAIMASEATDRPLGIDVDVSRYEGLLSILQYPWLSGQIEGHYPYLIPQAAVPGVELAKDGWVCVVGVTGPQWTDFKRMAGIPELDVPRYEALSDRVRLAAEVTPLIRRFTMQYTVDELVELGAKNRVPTVPVGTPETIAGLPPYASRGTYVTHPAGFVQPRSPFRYDGADEWSPGALPALGADNHATFAGRRQRAQGHGDPQQPLAGFRVLELGTFQAGPLVTRNLAALGADVVKVEAVNRPDLIRFAGVPPTVDRSWERAGPFVGTNLGKRGITADLSTPEGLQIVEKLIARSDLVLENFLPRVLDGRGLDYDGMRRIRPDVIMVRLPAWGLDGPWRDRPGFTYSVNATSGLCELTGYPDSDPLLTGTIVDPIASLFSTFITLAAIRRRHLTGVGGLIEVPLCDAAPQLTARAIIAASATGEIPTRNGNHDATHAPQGLYLGADDAWVAVSVATDEQWQAFGDLPGTAPWASDERFRERAGRVAHAGELDERMIAFCAATPAAELIRLLRAAGVPSAPLGTGTDAINDPRLLARGRVFELDHPAIGKISYIGPPMRYSHQPVATMTMASPVFGEHNHEVLSELGYSDAEIQALIDTNAIGDSPFGMAFQR